jgi:hypothetical protein
MRPGRQPLPDVLLASEAGGRRRWCHGQGALPLSVRVCERLGDLLIVASELQADLASDQAGALRELSPAVDEVVARIDALLKQLAA